VDTVRLILFLFTATLLVAGESVAQESPTIQGRWESDAHGLHLTLMLLPDGSGDFDGVPLHYSIRNKALTLRIGDQLSHYSYSLEGSTLSLTGGNLDGTVRFQRRPHEVGDSSKSLTGPNTFSGTDVGLIGLWSGNGEMIEFRADATCVYRGKSFSYRVSQGHILLDTRPGTLVLSYSLRGSQLELIVNGERAMYSRPAGY